VSRYQKKQSPTHTYPGQCDHQSSQICLLHPPQYTAPPPPAQSTCMTVFLHNLCLSPPWSTSQSGTLYPTPTYSLTQSLSSSRSTCPHYRNQPCCSTESISSNPSLSLNPPPGTPLFTPTQHIHLTTSIPACRSATPLPHRPGPTSMQHTTTHTTAA